MPADLTAFLADPDQESRRTELRDFIGPRPAVYLATYDRLRESSILATGGRPKLRVFPGGFSGSAFLLGPVWFFYRKLWTWAWAYVALLAVLAFLPRIGGIGVAVAFAFALSARRIYVEHAIKRLQRLRAENEGLLSLSSVQKAGGVAPVAGGLALAVYLFLIGISIAALVLQARGVLPAQ